MVAVIGTAVGSVLTAISYVNSLVGEGWTRYFIIIGGFSADNVVGTFTGVFVLESLLSFVISSVFRIDGFNIPIIEGVSSLLIIATIAPLIFYLIRSTLIGNQ